MNPDVVCAKAEKIYNDLRKNFANNFYNHFYNDFKNSVTLLEYARYEIQRGTSRSLIYQGESIEEYMQSMRKCSIHRDVEFEKELIDSAKKTIDKDQFDYCDHILSELRDYFKVFDNYKQNINNAKKSEGENSEYAKNLICDFENFIGMFDLAISYVEVKLENKIVNDKKAHEIRERIDALQDGAEEYRRDLATLLAKIREPEVDKGA